MDDDDDHEEEEDFMSFVAESSDKGEAKEAFYLKGQFISYWKIGVIYW